MKRDEGYKYSFKLAGRSASLYVQNTGRQQCLPRYRWGPGIRDHYLIHHVLVGARGSLVVGEKHYFLEAGDTFLVYPRPPSSTMPTRKTPGSMSGWASRGRRPPIWWNRPISPPSGPSCGASLPGGGVPPAAGAVRGVRHRPLERGSGYYRAAVPLSLLPDRPGRAAGRGGTNSGGLCRGGGPLYYGPL